jgi:hypothetical protein
MSNLRTNPLGHLGQKHQQEVVERGLRMDRLRDMEQVQHMFHTEIALDIAGQLMQNPQQQGCLEKGERSMPLMMLSDWTKALKRDQQELLRDSE